MKKIFIAVLLAVGMLTLASCSSGDTPGKALLGYMDQIQKGDYEAMANAIYFGEYTEEEAETVAKQRAQFAAMLETKFANELEKKQGLKDVVILNEEISEDGNSAVVEYKQIWGDGTENTSKQAMVKSNGEWLLKVEK